ncbi:zinc finger BED domain-containing protein RICESLEEPER 2-like [Nicotiana tabacum]|uniref:Zinc finger BED domain-containing protein RICESLEEPER 2-like n=1 Tax=Nicotiana tabacum TaxID=4097 RepID=A0AC58TRP7_TOBAC
MAHIINLVVQDGLRDGSVSVERIRQVVRYIRQSPARWKKFKECCDLDRITSKKSLCLDVPTRWNSTYLMLKVATVYEKAFTKYCDIDYGLMSCTSNCICENGQPASPLLSSDWDSVRQLMQNEDAFLREMTKNMKEKFDKYWGDPHKMNKMIFISCVLDPRHKFNTLSFALGAMFGEIIGLKIQEDVKTYMDTLFNVYAMKNGGSGSCPSSLSSSSLLSKFMLDLKKHKKCGGVDSKMELDKYLGEDVEEDYKKFNILGWWKLNSLRFPTLTEMARDVLAIPISSVASESAFSTGGRILVPFRSSLTPRLVKALVCVQDWIRNESTTPVKIEEDLDNLEQLEAESLTLSTYSDFPFVVQAQIFNLSHSPTENLKLRATFGLVAVWFERQLIVFCLGSSVWFGLNFERQLLHYVNFRLWFCLEMNDVYCPVTVVWRTGDEWI